MVANAKSKTNKTSGVSEKAIKKSTAKVQQKSLKLDTSLYSYDQYLHVLKNIANIVLNGSILNETKANQVPDNWINADYQAFYDDRAPVASVISLVYESSVSLKDAQTYVKNINKDIPNALTTESDVLGIIYGTLDESAINTTEDTPVESVEDTTDTVAIETYNSTEEPISDTGLVATNDKVELQDLVEDTKAVVATLPETKDITEDSDIETSIAKAFKGIDDTMIEKAKTVPVVTEEDSELGRGDLVEDLADEDIQSPTSSKPSVDTSILTANKSTDNLDYADDDTHPINFIGAKEKLIEEKTDIIMLYKPERCLRCTHLVGDVVFKDGKNTIKSFPYTECHPIYTDNPKPNRNCPAMSMSLTQGINIDKAVKSLVSAEDEFDSKRLSTIYSKISELDPMIAKEIQARKSIYRKSVLDV